MAVLRVEPMENGQWSIVRDGEAFGVSYETQAAAESALLEMVRGQGKLGVKKENGDGES